MCKNREICPLWTDPDTGNRIAATGCSADQLLPTAFEVTHEKRLTCECSGADGDRCGSAVLAYMLLHLDFETVL